MPAGGSCPSTTFPRFWPSIGISSPSSLSRSFLRCAWPHFAWSQNSFRRDVYREYMLVLSAIVFKLYPSSDTELINLTQWKSEPVKEGMKKISHLRKASTLFSADIYLESKGPSSWQVISRVQRTRMRGFEFPLGSDANSLYERQKFKTIGAAKDYISKKMFKLDHEFFRPSVQSLVPMKYENMFLTFGLYLLCYQYESRPKRA